MNQALRRHLATAELIALAAAYAPTPQEQRLREALDPRPEAPRAPIDPVRAPHFGAKQRAKLARRQG